MDIFKQINEIANVCESIINEATLTTPEIRARVEKQQEIAKKSQEENRPKKAKIEAAKEAIRNVLNNIKVNKENINCALSEEDEEQQKPKHWTQNQPSKSNMYYINKFGKGRNKSNYQRGQDIIRGSYKNYQTNKELSKYLEDTELMNRAVNILNHAYSQKGANIGRTFAAAQKAGIPRGVLHYLIQQRKQGGTN